MPAYDGTRFDPPAPLAHVNLRNPETGAVLPEVPMLLDSGADVTLLPRAVMRPLGRSAIPGDHYELVAFDGSTSFAAVTRLELQFCRRTFRGQFLLVEQAWGILGRNVLNAVAVFLDGPNLSWREQPGSRS
jgi:hypothetical protein